MKISYIKYFFVAAVNLRIKSAEMKTGELSALNMWLSLTKPHFFFSWIHKLWKISSPTDQRRVTTESGWVCFAV